MRKPAERFPGSLLDDPKPTEAMTPTDYLGPIDPKFQEYLEDRGLLETVLETRAALKEFDLIMAKFPGLYAQYCERCKAARIMPKVIQ